ncbi:hypothetical protein MZM54_00745 [[Brevibacterium] frigoritolerans]|nr:hypothetical protein [Peribacillus frigoritolerans]
MFNKLNYSYHYFLIRHTFRCICIQYCDVDIEISIIDLRDQRDNRQMLENIAEGKAKLWDLRKEIKKEGFKLDEQFTIMQFENEFSVDTYLEIKNCPCKINWYGGSEVGITEEIKYLLYTDYDQSVLNQNIGYNQRRYGAKLGVWDELLEIETKQKEINNEYYNLKELKLEKLEKRLKELENKKEELDNKWVYTRDELCQLNEQDFTYKIDELTDLKTKWKPIKKSK